jgi:hypothetical protein
MINPFLQKRVIFHAFPEFSAIKRPSLAQNKNGAIDHIERENS